MREQSRGYEPCALSNRGRASRSVVRIHHASQPAIARGLLRRLQRVQLLVGAGLYQFLPVKHMCLSSCRSPAACVDRRRTGVVEAFRIGARQGHSGLACCWVLRLLLFAGGVMNLAVIVALTLIVLFQQVAPFGMRSTPVSGAVVHTARAARPSVSNSHEARRRRRNQPLRIEETTGDLTCAALSDMEPPPAIRCAYDFGFSRVGDDADLREVLQPLKGQNIQGGGSRTQCFRAVQSWFQTPRLSKHVEVATK
jgi:Predicted metal-binding integral membrane protein (DUF2182)